MFNIRKWIPLLMLLLTTAALVGAITMSKQSSYNKNSSETSTFEWIGMPLPGSYLCI